MPKKPKGGRRNISWEKIKADYVTDPGLSLKKAAEKYGVPVRTVAEHSKADNWFATKQEHQKQYCDELAEKLHQKKLESLEQELEAILTISDKISETLKNDPHQFNRYLAQAEKPEILTSGNVSRVGVYKYVEEKMFQKEIDKFIECIETGEKLQSHIDTNIITAQMMDAIYRSAEEHREVTL